MARETKQERLVRVMFDQMNEHLHELKSMASNPATKELDLERWCQSLLRNCLGFTASGGYSIRAQESRGKLRPDLLMSKGDKVFCVVEVKKLGFDLNKSDLRSGKAQLGEYLTTLGDAQWGLLTNGYQWKLFDFSNRTAGGIELISFDLRSETDEIEISRKAVEETCWNFVDIHEATYSSKDWTEFSREATAFSPESIARAILSTDAVKYIARIIRGEHDYRVNPEVLFEKLQSIVENGLDDSVTGWNETKQAEFRKYVSGQKRASRRKRSSAAKEVKADTLNASEAPECNAPNQPSQAQIDTAIATEKVALAAKTEDSSTGDAA